MGATAKAEEAAVFGKGDAGGTLVAEGGRGGGLTDRVAGFLSVFEVAQDDLAVAFIVGETVGEPNAVGRDDGRVDALPGEDIAGFDRAGGGLSGGGNRARQSDGEANRSGNGHFRILTTDG